MGRPRTWTDVELATAVQQARSLCHCSKLLNLKGGKGYRTLPPHIERLGLSTGHWTGRKNSGNPNGYRVWDLEREVLVENSAYTHRTDLKHQLLKLGILKEECELCGMGPSWNGRSLVLQMDHRNGDGRDHRRENLRMLCPNCHSQTPTYAGRNSRSKP